MSFPNWKRLLEISPEAWLLAAAVALLSYLVLYGALRLIGGRIDALAHRTGHLAGRIVAEVLQSTNRFILLLISLLIGLGTIELNASWEVWLSHGWVLLIGLQIALWLNRAISVWLRNYHARADATDLRDRATTSTLVFLMRFVVWLTALLAVLANLGINITALVASLGVGGIAVALGLQTVLSDLFASLAIAFDKPFEVGHFITFGEISGTVVRVGIKTTRIASLSGELVIISNTELLKKIVHNYKHLRQRRAVFNFRLSYQTTPSQAAEMAQVVKQIICAIDDTRFDRAHLKGFGDNALEYEAVYYVLVSDYNVYMDIQQRINLELMQACAVRNIQLGQPARTLQVTPNSAAAMSAALVPQPPA